jgi:hypothetical protein
MSNSRTRRKAKRAHRNTARSSRPVKPPSEEFNFVEFLRTSLNREHPSEFLGLVSYMIQTLTPDRYASLRREKPPPTDLAGFVDQCIAVRDPVRTALLTVFAEMVDDEWVKLRCRRELATRDDVLPGWITKLSSVEARGAARMTHVLGDRDEVMIGIRLANEFDLTCVVLIDHYRFDSIRDVALLPDSLETVLANAAQELAEGDLSRVDMTLADARAWISQDIERDLVLPGPEPARWPGARPLLRWLIQHLPEGGDEYKEPDWDSEDSAEMFDEFFASIGGNPFDHRDLRELLSEVCGNTGIGDPLRWSVSRIAQVADLSFDRYSRVSVASILQLPALLRAFVPSAHARSGVRDGLTADALAAIDGLSTGVRRR